MQKLVMVVLVLSLLGTRSAGATSYAPILVLFDFDRATINADGQTVIDLVVSEYAKHPDSYIALSGNADRAGSEDYNMALSRRRANAVRDALIAGGIPADRILVAARGEGVPAVATADGVKERWNRSVMVVLQ
jgi:OOP family OmpA-OmpF porin